MATTPLQTTRIISIISREPQSFYRCLGGTLKPAAGGGGGTAAARGERLHREALSLYSTWVRGYKCNVAQRFQIRFLQGFFTMAEKVVSQPVPLQTCFGMGIQAA